MKIKILLAGCSLLVLAACGSGSVKETLGINRKAPDEFRVVARPPLSVPPQFNLQPPSASAESPTVVPADKQAKSLVIGGGAAKEGDTFSLKQGAADTAVTPVSSAPLSKTAGESSSNSEQQFLKKIGADKADPKVRDELVQQQISVQEKKEEAGWWNVFSAPEKKEALVDASGEAERIKANKEAGKPVTEGQTPEAKDKDRGWLREWIGW